MLAPQKLQLQKSSPQIIGNAHKGCLGMGANGTTMVCVLRTIVNILEPVAQRARGIHGRGRSGHPTPSTREHSHLGGFHTGCIGPWATMVIELARNLRTVVQILQPIAQCAGSLLGWGHIGQPTITINQEAQASVPLESSHGHPPRPHLLAQGAADRLQTVPRRSREENVSSVRPRAHRYQSPQWKRPYARHAE